MFSSEVGHIALHALIKEHYNCSITNKINHCKSLIALNSISGEKGKGGGGGSGVG